MNNLTVAILAKNESANLQELLPLIKEAGEILIIEDQPDEQTAKVATKFGAKLITFPVGEDFARARNFALTKSHYPWVLFLDADERPTPGLLAWLRQFKPPATPASYAFWRRDWFFKKQLKYGEVGQVWVNRLVRKGNGEFRRPVHEVWTSSAPVHKVKQVINHYPHPTVSEFLEHINQYSSLNAAYWQKNNRRTNALEVATVPILKFVYIYFLKLGFLDGAPGFIYAFMMSFHSFLSRAKLYTSIHAN